MLKGPEGFRAVETLSEIKLFVASVFSRLVFFCCVQHVNIMIDCASFEVLIIYRYVELTKVRLNFFLCFALWTRLTGSCSAM